MQNSRYKVMLIIHSLKIGGAEVMVENLAYALDELGADVRVVSLHDISSPITDRLVLNKIKLIYLGKKSGFDSSVWSRLSVLMSEFNPDVIHTHLPVLHYVVPAAKKAGVTNIVHTLHSVADKETGNTFLRVLNRIYFKTGLVRPVALSNENRRSISDYYDMDMERVPVVLNGINLGLFSCARSYEMHLPVVLLHVGRFVPLKNQALLVRCLKMLVDAGEDVELVFLGDGPEMDSVKILSADLGVVDRISFVGSTNAVSEHMANADIFLLPSQYEGIPMSVAEAMASGLPIIASNVGGIPDMLKNGYSAKLVEPNANEIVTSVQELINNKSERARLGKAAFGESRRFDYKTMGKHYLEIYKGKTNGC